MKTSKTFLWFKSLLTVVMLLVATNGFSQIKTPLEQSGFNELSKHQETMDYLEKLCAANKHVSLEIIGQSLEGRNIPVLYFTRDKKFGSMRSEKPVVMVFCQQHGNEPSGKEAALIVARELTQNSSAILDNIDLLLIPVVNPDGAELLKRRNARDMDLNRNHVVLSEPEVLALHRLYKKWNPQVTLDIHEYNSIRKSFIEEGYIKNADEMLGGATNLNVNKELISFSRDVMIARIGAMIEDKGFTFSRYIVGGPPASSRIRYSTTNINDGRQSMAIYNNLSFIFEGKRFDDPTQDIKRRTMGQVAALNAFLETVSDNHSRIIELVARAQAELLDMNYAHNNPSYLQMDYFADTNNPVIKFPVFDLYKWKPIVKELNNFQPLVKVKISVFKPVAYLIPSGGETDLIDLLKRHDIKLSYLKEDINLDAEIYRIKHVTDAIDEDKPAKNIDMNKLSEERRFLKGSVLVFLNQPASNLIPLLLEPQSSWGVVSERSMLQYCFDNYLEEGTEFPVVRIVEAIPGDMIEKKL